MVDIPPGAGEDGNVRFVSAVWTPVTENDEVTPLRLTGAIYSDIILEVSGTFGGATVTPQWSTDKSTWFTAADVSGASSTLTAAGFIILRDQFPYFRVSISGGTSQSLTIKLGLMRIT